MPLRQLLRKRLPDDMEEKVVQFHCFVIAASQRVGYPLSRIIKMDETLMRFELPSSCSLESIPWVQAHMVRGSFVHCSDWSSVRHQACSGAVHLASSPLPSLNFSPFHCFISVTGAWNGGSWLGCGDLPAIGVVFYLGVGWPQWKPLGIPGTLLPLKRGSWLTCCKEIAPLYYATFLCKCFGQLILPLKFW